MSNVIELPTPRRVATEDIVSILEDYLELARLGKIQAIAVAAVSREGCALRSAVPSDIATNLVGSLAMLQQMVIRDALEDQSE